MAKIVYISYLTRYFEPLIIHGPTIIEYFDCLIGILRPLHKDYVTGYGQTSSTLASFAVDGDNVIGVLTQEKKSV